MVWWWWFLTPAREGSHAGSGMQSGGDSPRHPLHGGISSFRAPWPLTRDSPFLEPPSVHSAAGIRLALLLACAQLPLATAVAAATLTHIAEDKRALPRVLDVCESNPSIGGFRVSVSTSVMKRFSIFFWLE